MSDNLTVKEQSLLDALLTCRTIQDAAAQAGVPYSTARRWLATRPALKERLAELRDEAQAEALHATLALSQRAREVVLAILDDSEVADYVRLQAAKLALDYEATLRQGADTSEQLSEIERLLVQAQADAHGRYRPASQPSEPATRAHLTLLP